MPMYYYSAYGLIIQSEIYCSGLSPANPAEPDVRIEFGNIMSLPEIPHDKNKNYYVSENQFLIHLTNIARYLVSSGNKIIVAPCPQAGDAEIQLYLQGMALGAILHQRNYLPIHGNGVVINNKCIIFAGHTGRGKSTLAAAFARKGAKLLSDDTCAIKFDMNNRPNVYPGTPNIKLFQNTAKQLGFSLTNGTQLAPEEDKYSIPLDDSHETRVLPVSALYVLRFHDSGAIKHQTLSTRDAVNAIANHTYKKKMISTMKRTERHFELCTSLSRKIAVTRLLRPRSLKRLDDITEYFLTHF